MGPRESTSDVCQPSSRAHAHAGNWSERLLKSLYYVTWKHGDQLLQETEALWQTVARNRRNVIPVLDFLLSRGLQEGASQTTAQVRAPA